MPNTNAFGPYDHPLFTVRHQSQLYSDAHAAAASTVDFAPFRSKLKVAVTQISLVLKSIWSAGAGSTPSITVFRNGTAIRTLAASILSKLTVGSLPTSIPTWVTFNLTSSNTLHSFGELLALRLSEAGGALDVMYTYEVLPDQPSTIDDQSTG